jgi:hypothetical protein
MMHYCLGCEAQEFLRCEETTRSFDFALRMTNFILNELDR